MCCSPGAAMSTPDPSWVASEGFAHANGVAGSFLVPTTRIGGAVGALHRRRGCTLHRPQRARDRVVHDRPAEPRRRLRRGRLDRPARRSPCRPAARRRSRWRGMPLRCCRRSRRGALGVAVGELGYRPAVAPVGGVERRSRGSRSRRGPRTAPMPRGRGRTRSATAFARASRRARHDPHGRHAPARRSNAGAGLAVAMEVARRVSRRTTSGTR